MLSEERLTEFGIYQGLSPVAAARRAKEEVEERAMERGDVVQDCNGELWVVDEVRGDGIRAVRYDCSHDGLIIKRLHPCSVTKVGHTENVPDLRNC